MTKIQNLKCFGHWVLEFEYCLLFGAWNFLKSTHLHLNVLFDFCTVYFKKRSCPVTRFDTF
jgi:hypothetical protein